MPVDYSQLQVYLESLVPIRNKELMKMETRAKAEEFPILGPASCQMCYLLARLIGAKNVFEMGSGFGYSTAWFARAVEENGGGTVHHTVWDKDLSEQARRHLAVMGYGQKGSGTKVEITYTMGEAVAALKESTGPYDIIFNDIDKDAYPDTIDVVHQKLRPGGLFITDNVVWSGRVTEPSPDETTQKILEFSARLCASDNWICSIAPIRDGLMIAKKV